MYIALAVASAPLYLPDDYVSHLLSLLLPLLFFQLNHKANLPDTLMAEPFPSSVWRLTNSEASDVRINITYNLNGKLKRPFIKKIPI